MLSTTLGALATAGCSAAGAAALAPPEKPEITVAVVPAVTNLGLFLAQQKGFFTQAGLRVRLKSVASSTLAINEQLAGTIDITGGAYVSYIATQAASQGKVSWRILAEGSTSRPLSQQILISPQSPVHALADLKGKRIGVNILGNIGSLLIDSALATQGIAATAVTQVAIPFPTMGKALAQGDIAAGWFDEPFLSEVQANIGAQSLFDTAQGATQGFPISGYIATSHWARTFPNTAKAFVSAIEQGQTLADSSRASAEAAMSKFITGVSPTTASLVTIDDYPVSVSQSQVQRVADVMFEFGLLKQHFDIATMIN